MTHGRQPLVSGAVVVLCAPTQVWSAADGSIGASPIDGVYHGDTRFVRAALLACGGAAPEHIAATVADATSASFIALLRDVDDAMPDPKVVLERARHVGGGTLTEHLEVRSHLDVSVTVGLELRLEPEFAPLHEVKTGRAEPRDWDWDAPIVRSGTAEFVLDAPEATVETTPDGALLVRWRLECPARGVAGASWSMAMTDPTLVVRAVASDPGWRVDEEASDRRASRWVHAALADLRALRLELSELPGEPFLAAGAPWFLTLFGRDSLWAARLLLPIDIGIAASTLRVLAALQGRSTDVARAEEPGKILHELRAAAFPIPEEGSVLPPIYYGTVDATPLWVCLLVDAARQGLAADVVRELLPHLTAALSWITLSAGSDGFLDYVDESGSGLINQGWKDSSDSIQWRDGRLAEGPIALCEVQGYAYEAVMGGASLYDAYGIDGADELRAWAQSLRRRFRERFWVSTPEGRYPAIAIDQHGHAVDTLTSNIGHLLGTGLLDSEEERAVSALLVGESMNSGFGVRTMSTGASGYWPLSYHGGSVWPHDTAIVARGMALAGRHEDAKRLTDGLLVAAEAFAYRMPELYGGKACETGSLGRSPVPVPYPAACRPQAWSAAAAVTAMGMYRV